MRATLAIARRELGGYFASPVGWIGLCAFVFLCGVFFSLSLWAYGMQSAQAFNPYQAEQMDLHSMLLVPVLGNIGVIALLVMPAMTMGLIAADRANKSIELLLTSPVTSTQIVLGKFLGALAFSLVMIAGTLFIPITLDWLGEPDPNILATNYLSLLLMFGAYVAIGMFASAMTENQLIALVVPFAFNLLAFIVGWIGELLDDGALKEVVQFASTVHHVQHLGEGLIHLSDIVYFLSFIAFFLFATTQRVEALRWR